MFSLEQQVAERWMLHLLQWEPDSRLQPSARDSTALHSAQVHRGSAQLHPRLAPLHLHSDPQPPAVSTQEKNTGGDEAIV